MSGLAIISSKTSSKVTRTRKEQTLDLAIVKREYKKKGWYKIALKVIDIFGNDTTKVVEINV